MKRLVHGSIAITLQILFMHFNPVLAQTASTTALYRAVNAQSGDHFYTIDATESARAIAQSGYQSEGITAFVYATQQQGTVPLYRLYNPQSKDHFYTADSAENARAVAQSGYQSEGIAAFVYATQQQGTVPLYRLYNFQSLHHFYTIDADENARAIAQSGYKSEGIAAYVFSPVPLYRLYNSKSGDHFYTTDSGENARAIAQSGYASEGIAGYVFASQQTGTVPLYRLYNSKSGDHFYTTNSSENARAIAQSGYAGEGIAAYVFAIQQRATAPLYRLYNSKNGDHFYTASACENTKAIEQSGYQSEGLAAYIFPSAPLGPVAGDNSWETPNGTVSAGPSTAGLTVNLAGDAAALYAVSLNAGVWRSTAGGTWVQLPTSPRWAYSIDVDPNDASHIAVGERRGDYIDPKGSSSGLWESFDMGTNWAYTFDPLSLNGCKSREVPAVAFSKTSTLFIGTACGIGRKPTGSNGFDFSFSPAGIGSITALSASDNKIWARTQSQLLFTSTDGKSWATRTIPATLGGQAISFVPMANDAYSLGGFDFAAYMTCCADPTPPCGNLNRLLIYNSGVDQWELQPNLLDSKGNPLMGCDGTGLGGRRFVRSFSLKRPDLPNIVGQRLQLFYGAGQIVYQATGLKNDGSVESWTKLVEADWAGSTNPDPVHSDLWSFILSADGKNEWLSCDGGVYSRSVDPASGWSTRISGLHTQHIHTLTTLTTTPDSPARLAYPTSDNDAWFGNPSTGFAAESSLGDVNWTAGDAANPSVALLVRQTTLACNPHKPIAFLTGFGANLPSGSPLQDVQIIDDSTFTGPTFFHFIQSLAGDAPLGFSLDAVMLAKLPLQYSDQNTCKLSNVSGSLGNPDPDGSENLVLLRNKNYVSTPDINASKGAGWAIAANSLPPGTQAFWVSGGHSQPIYYVLASQSGQIKLFKGSGLPPPNKTQWTELNVQGNALQPLPYPASGILVGGWNGPVFVNPYDPTQIYVLTSSGIQVSFDGGFSFQHDAELTNLITGGSRFPLVGSFGGGDGNGVPIASRANSMSTLSDMAFYRENPKIAVAGSPFTGVFYKDESGKWHDLSSLLPHPFSPVSAIGVDCQAIYVATEGRSLFRIVGYQGAIN